MGSDKTDQMKKWSADFGNEYTDRNSLGVPGLEALYQKRFGTPRSALNDEFLKPVKKDSRILEVGCNIGLQLRLLEKQGFSDLWGIEISPYALSQARSEIKNMNLVLGSALDLPFRDNYFDMAFTSGVLIHISPKDVGKAMDEICRVSKRYIWGFEYFAESCEAIDYRGNKNLLWRNNFAKVYMERHGGLKLLKEKRMKYSDSENIDSMFLLEKTR